MLLFYIKRKLKKKLCTEKPDSQTGQAKINFKLQLDK